MSLEGVILSFMAEKWQNLSFLGRTRNSVPVPKGGGGGVTGTHGIEAKWHRYRSKWYRYRCF